MPSTSADPAPCEDTVGWENTRGKVCQDYTAWCANGEFKQGSEWAAGEVFNFPEQHCCLCGKAAQTAAAAPSDRAPAFSLHANTLCVGADHEVRSTTVESCEAKCEQSHCGCFFFHRGACSFSAVHGGLQPTGKGYVSHVRIGATAAPKDPRSSPPGGSGRCGAPPRMTGSPPSFYMYDEPAFEWGERLTRCFEGTHGLAPWALAVNDSAHERDGAPSTQLAHGLWLHQALRRHPSRVASPERAALFVVPAYGSLSEAAAGCDGTSHLRRMEAAAAALRGSAWWSSAPTRHVLLAATLPDDRNALGALGELAAKGGAVALCADTLRCARGFQHRVVIPPLPLAPLAQLSVRDQTVRQACGGSAARRRSYSVFFRGVHAHAHEAQELRARLWSLRTLAGASVKFTRGGATSLEPSTRAWLSAHGWTKDVRVPFNALSYAYTALHSDFCVVVRGDGQNEGRELVDAVAAGCETHHLLDPLLKLLTPPHHPMLLVKMRDASSRISGCVPLIIGDKTVLPFRRKLGGLLPYADFTVGVDELEYLRYPSETVAKAMDEALPRLALLRRNLLGARESLLLGYGEAPLRYNMSLAYGADSILRAVGKLLCPRNPASLRACIGEQAGAGATVFF